MTSETNDFSEKLRAHRAHMAALPPAIALATGLVIDFDGRAMSDAEPPRDGLTCGMLRTLLAEIERLQGQVKQQHKDAIEAEREFAREARQIAAEARFEERSHHDGAGYF